MKSITIDLNNILEVLLRNEDFEILPVLDGSKTIIIYRVRQNIVGFSEIIKDAENSFNKAFQEFKEIYTNHFSKWFNYEPILILYKTGETDISEELCDKIELNPYFCRKFVIDLTKDLKNEIRRLPFVPLKPENIVGLKRPKTAKTFLANHQINSKLSEYITIPYKRSEKGITEECFQSKLGEPIWHKKEINEYFPLDYENKTKIRLKKIIINNFRAYQGRHEFDLDADLIVLFGPNGFGKTSFFDAIDFACTGGVTRLDKRFGQKVDRLLNSLKHLDSKIDDSSINVKASIENREIEFTRSVKNRTEVYIDSINNDRKNILMLLTGLSKDSSDLRVENLINLFRATHIFGQDSQSLTYGFKETSKLPEDTVSRMLALQDYIEGINKLKKIFEELNKQIKEAEQEIFHLKGSSISKKTEIRKIKNTVKILENPEKINMLGKTLIKKTINQLNIPFQTNNEVSVDTFRDLRGIIELRINEINKNLDEIYWLEERLPEFLDLKNKLDNTIKKLASERELLLQLNNDYSSKQKILEETENNYNNMLLKEKSYFIIKENLEWLLQIQSVYKKIKESIESDNNNLQEAQKKLIEKDNKIKKTESSLNYFKENINIISDKIQSIELNEAKLKDIKNNLYIWEKSLDRKIEVEEHNHEINQYLNKIRNDILSIKHKLKLEAKVQCKLEENYKESQKSQSELLTILDSVEEHIITNVCPVCGTFHNSREDLIRKLKIQKNNQSVETKKSFEMLQKSEIKIENLKKVIFDLEFKLELHLKKVKENDLELEDLTKVIKKYVEEASMLELPKFPENIDSIIDSKIKDLNLQKSSKNEELSKMKIEFQNENKLYSGYMNNKKILTGKIQELNSKLFLNQDIRKKIEKDAFIRQVSLGVDTEEIKKRILELDNSLKDFSFQIKNSQNILNTLKITLNNQIGKKQKLESKIAEIQSEIQKNKKYIEEIKMKLKRLNFNEDIELDRVEYFKENFNKKLLQSSVLRDEITNFTIALDNIQLSANLIKITNDLEKITKQIKDSKNKLAKKNQWLSFFQIIYKELELLRSKTIIEYIDKYGPLTSTIQRRLRSVYGFGNIKLKQEKGEISIKVERKNSGDIIPSDYFSESQVQIVMLSLFLSANLTQTWSSFVPILLDDPVTHFDDLNAYSLLELIRGLLLESDKKYQFIISTCEERLYRLMYQKFSKINKKVIFYTFESIGKDGPKIKKEINNI